MESNLDILEKLLSLKDNQSNYISLVCKQFHTKLNEKVIFNQFLEKFSSFSRNADKLNVVKEYFEWVPLDNLIKSKYQKNSEISAALRNHGNIAYQKRCNVDAVRLYNLAIMFAVPGEPELGLAYANRSAALNSIGLTEEALQDINLALLNGYPGESDKRKKLEERKKRFKTQLAKLSKSPSYKQMNIEVLKRNEYYKNMFTLKTPNPLAPSLDNSVDIKYTTSRGRHLVANRDIPIGATVLVERPFAAALKNVWDVDHCHHCFKKNLQCIPCSQCVFTLYCNERCLAQAQEYHQYECACLPELHCVSKDYVGGNLQLAYKVICVVGPKKLLSLFNERKTASCELGSRGNINLIAGRDPISSIYEPNSYRAIGSLMAARIQEDNLLYYLLIIALTLSYALDANSGFFDSVSVTDADKPDFLDFAAEFLVHNLETSRRNSFGLREFTNVEGVTLQTQMESKSNGMLEFGYKTVATGTFATASLLNHSCCQNVARFTGKTFGRMAIVSLKSIKKGEELFSTYGPLYGGIGPDEYNTYTRQAALKPYEFECDCIACKYDWPKIHELAKIKPSFCCPTCVTKFIHDSQMSPEFFKCKLSGDFKCKSCKTQHSKQWIEEEYHRHCSTLGMCYQLIDMNSPLIAISNLKAALQFFEMYVCPPNYFNLIGSQLYREATKLIIFFSENDL